MTSPPVGFGNPRATCRSGFLPLRRNRSAHGLTPRTGLTPGTHPAQHVIRNLAAGPTLKLRYIRRPRVSCQVTQVVRIGRWWAVELSPNLATRDSVRLGPAGRSQLVHEGNRVLEPLRGVNCRHGPGGRGAHRRAGGRADSNSQPLSLLVSHPGCSLYAPDHWPD